MSNINDRPPKITDEHTTFFDRQDKWETQRQKKRTCVLCAQKQKRNTLMTDNLCPNCFHAREQHRANLERAAKRREYLKATQGPK